MVMIKKILSVLALFASLFFCHAIFAQVEAHPTIEDLPSSVPVEVDTSLYVWNLYNVDEKNGTFNADLYLVLKWKDARLAFQEESKSLIFADSSASEKLKEIWWPELDFVNASVLNTRNLVLTIDPTGIVTYSVKISGTFFVDMDLRKFPFDKQAFAIRIQSFFWDAEKVQFIADPASTGFLKNSEVEGLRITDLTISLTKEKFPFMEEAYSQYMATIQLQRSPSFFLYQILIPLVIILGMSSCMFYLNIEDLSNRLVLGQSAILVLVAMKFLINQDLPQIDYLTIVDYIFFLAYFCSGLTIILSVIDFKLWKKHNSLSATLNRRVAWIPLALFFIVYVLLLFVAKVL